VAAVAVYSLVELLVRVVLVVAVLEALEPLRLPTEQLTLVAVVAVVGRQAVTGELAETVVREL
jgi:hypothetical protein